MLLVSVSALKMPDWMSCINDDVSIFDVSMPGTHDSAAVFDETIL